jgi:hypothetical protein
MALRLAFRHIAPIDFEKLLELPGRTALAAASLRHCPEWAFSIDKHEVMVCNDGMATMTHRTTFALDIDTMRRLKKLSLRWQVSQAEVVRRALSQAESVPDAQPLDALARLKSYHAEATLEVSAADAYLAQARADRKRWRRP